MRRPRIRSLLVGALLLGPLAGPAGATDREQVRAEGIVSAYERNDRWPVKALALLSLGSRWHPAAAPIVADALQSGDPRLEAYAFETLSGMAPTDLRRVLTADLVEALVAWQERVRNDRVRVELLLFLVKAFPSVQVRTPAEWRSWWEEVRGLWTPDPWPEASPDANDGGGESRTVPGVLERAFDLSVGGIQLVLVLDSTGSMRTTIDAVKLGLGDLVRILAGFTEDLEIGLVHYRDREDFSRRGRGTDGEGARELVRLTRDTRRVEAELERLDAAGGGDFPERVTAGMWVALQRRMGWKAERNRMVMVIGDAPPKEQEAAEALAKKARLEPEAFLPSARAVATGGAAPGRPRPFVVSTVAVGLGAADPETSRAFRRISAAGGGVHAVFDASADPEEAGSAIVHRLIELSFGERYLAEAARFVDVYYRYRDAGFIED